MGVQVLEAAGVAAATAVSVALSVGWGLAVEVEVAIIGVAEGDGEKVGVALGELVPEAEGETIAVGEKVADARLKPAKALGGPGRQPTLPSSITAIML